MSERYITDPEMTYRKAVQSEGIPIGYTDHTDGTIDERQMSHTCVWHWISWLASLTTLTDQALTLARAKDAQFELHRMLVPIHPQKYRSTNRRLILERAAETLRVATDFQRLFVQRIFPRLCNKGFAATG
jgi:hypothetical protein